MSKYRELNGEHIEKQLGKAIIVTAQQGGVGKSYLSESLFVNSYANGENVCLVEIEQQEDDTIAFGLKPEDVVESSVRALIERAFNPKCPVAKTVSVIDSPVLKTYRKNADKINPNHIPFGQRAELITSDSDLNKLIKDEIDSHGGQYTFDVMLQKETNKLREVFDKVIYATPISTRGSIVAETAMRLARKDDGIVIVDSFLTSAINNAKLVEDLTRPDALNGAGNKPKFIGVMNNWYKDGINVLEQLEPEVQTAIFNGDASNAIHYYKRLAYGDAYCKNVTNMKAAHKKEVKPYDDCTITSEYNKDGTRKKQPIKNGMEDACCEIFKKLNDKTFGSFFDTANPTKIGQLAQSLDKLKRAVDDEQNYADERRRGKK